MMWSIAPQLCMAFKGVTPSDFFDRYDGEGGYQRALLDITIAQEMNEQIREAHSPADVGTGGIKRLTKDDANAVIARRDARRRARAEAERKGNI